MAISLLVIAASRMATASTFEKWLIMPGPVVLSHEVTESACENCHDPLSDLPQFELCIGCHVDVGKDLMEKSGFHGRLPEAQRFECADCHTDHEGRDANIVDLDKKAFNHELTNFSLSGEHTSVACGDCHVADKKHRDAESTCIACHRVDDPHGGMLGQECDSCHNASDWFTTTFDHDDTTFQLTGMHESVDCTACHVSSIFPDINRTCTGCHENDDVHNGRNGPQCADCHTTDAWSALTFNHSEVTGFRLDGGHKGLDCQDCHASSNFLDLGGSDCVACHRDDDVHESRNGGDCASCHLVSSWSNMDFDHKSRTDVALPAGHETLACGACHTGTVHDELPRSCSGCHAGEDPHGGQLGLQCASCHVASNWTAKVWFDHDLMSFPLMGAHSEVPCDQCHASAAFHDAATDCAGCHVSDDPHGSAFGNQCVDCHNPSNWASWQFDHNTRTGFVLSGAHGDLVCATCHKEGIGESSAVSVACISCHRREDPHFGRFGKKCDSCHNTSSFSEIEGM